MGNNKSAASGDTRSKANARQTSTVPKDTMPRRRVNIERIQNVLLVWLDSNNNKDCRNNVTQLRHAVNDIRTYTDGDRCIQFIETITSNKVCMIISGALGQHIMPRLHTMSQVDSIFIFCGNKTSHEEWVKKWPKIKGIFTEISPICEAIKQTAHQCEQNAISISFVATTADGACNKTLDRLDPSFMYTQILQEILLTIKFQEQHIKVFINYCREVFVGNGHDPKQFDEFKREYHGKTPIWWYTGQGFLYSMLNSALRLTNVDVIVRMGFFISDLHRHIEQLYSKQFAGQSSSAAFTVYRGQGLSKTDFDQLTKTKGGLMSFNSFLSTSKNRDVSFVFAESNQNNPDLIGILFIMKIDPSQSSIPFASIHNVSYFREEDEVLFSMHSIFRINDIKPMDENNRLFEVNLTLTSDNDQDLRRLTDRIREDSFPTAEGWYRLGSVLLKMGQSDKAQEVYEVLLHQTTNESEKAHIYNQLGWVKYGQGGYQEAIACYTKSLVIYEKTLHPNHLNFACSYNNIGLVYYNMGNYQKALSSHQKALEIKHQSLPSNHPDLANSYNNIGLVYDSMGDYPKALLSHEKTLQIRQQSLLPNHPDLAVSYNNIGNVYGIMGDYPKALSFYKKAFELQQQSLPPNHPVLGTFYNNIGMVYHSMGDYPKALSSHEKALAIRQQSLAPNHPDLAKSYNNIGIVYDSKGDYLIALSSFEKALDISQKALPSNHPDLAIFYNSIGEVCRKMGEHSRSLSYHGKALKIQQLALPPNHPDLAASYNNIGMVYDSMGNYSKAHSCYEHAVDIGQQSLLRNHSHLQDYRNNLELVRKKL